VEGGEEDEMDERMVIEVLGEMGWSLREGEAALACKDFGGREALAYYHGNTLSFEFWSEGRNVASLARSLPKSEEEVRAAVRFAEKLIKESFYMRFLA
jgi:hypothetical protein